MENKLNYRDEQLQRVVMNTLTEIFKDNVSKPVLGGKTLTDNDEGYLDFLDRVSSYVNHLKENI